MLNRVFTIVFSILFTSLLSAQEWKLKLSSNVELRTWKLTSTYEKEEKPLQGAKIVLTKAGGGVVEETSTDGSGDFTIMVPPNGEFILTVSFGGCNTKRFSVSTTGVPESYSKETKPFSFSIGGFIMARAYPGIDYSALEQPLIKVEWMTKKKVFDNDETVTGRGIESIGNINAAENALMQKFCGLNKQGDAALAKPDCPLAKKLYQEATALIPFETYPVLQLQKVGECLKNQSEAAAKAAEEAAKKAAAEKAAAEKAAADKIAAEKAAAEKAAATKAANEAAAAAAKEEAARKKAEADAAAKAKADAKAEEERKKKEGLAKSIQEDKDAEKAALEKKKQKEKEKAEAEAKAQAAYEAEEKAEAEKKAAARKAKEEEEELKRKQAEAEAANDPNNKKGNSKYGIYGVLGEDKYKGTIKKADDYFKMKRWSEAKTAYEEALGYKKDDPYAKSKLEQVNKMLAPK